MCPNPETKVEEKIDISSGEDATWNKSPDFLNEIPAEENVMCEVN